MPPSRQQADPVGSDQTIGKLGSLSPKSPYKLDKNRSHHIDNIKGVIPINNASFAKVGAFLRLYRNFSSTVLKAAVKRIIGKLPGFKVVDEQKDSDTIVIEYNNRVVGFDFHPEPGSAKPWSSSDSVSVRYEMKKGRAS